MLEILLVIALPVTYLLMVFFIINSTYKKMK